MLNMVVEKYHEKISFRQSKWLGKTLILTLKKF